MGDDIVPLPDVNTENSDVQSMISQWIKTTVAHLIMVSSYSKVETYGIDGLRIDAAKSIPYSFAQMVNNATDSYSIGEVFDGDAGYACAYQANGLDAFLNFPIYYQVLYPIRLISNIDGWCILLNNINANGRISGSGSHYSSSLSRHDSAWNILGRSRCRSNGILY